MISKSGIKFQMGYLVISSKISSFIEPYPLSPKKLNNPYDPIAHEIKKTGITIRYLDNSNDKFTYEVQLFKIN